MQEFSRRKNSPALFHSFAGHSGPVLSFALSSDFKYVVSGSEDATVKLWDLHARRCVRSFAGHAHAVRGVDVVASFTKEAPTGGRIVSGSADGTARVWDAMLATCVKVVRSHTNVW